MTELRQKARSLMMFAGMLRYRLTSEVRCFVLLSFSTSTLILTTQTYASLTRLDVFIH